MSLVDNRLTRVHRELFHGEIARTVRRAIVTGALRPGQRLREQDLSEQLGVSRAPVREALRLLTSEGLVVSVPHRGTFVAELSDRDIEEIYSLRLALESLALEQVMDRGVTDDGIEQLRCVVRAMEKVLSDQRHSDMPALDMRFHEVLCELSGHGHLLRAWRRIGNQLASFFAVADRLYAKEEHLEKHERLVALIESGDKYRALSELQNHINATGARLAKRRNDQNKQEGGDA